MRTFFRISLILVSLALSSCVKTGGEATESFHIDGNIDKAPDGTRVCLQTDDEQNTHTIMETATAGGKFSFDGRQDSCIECNVTYEIDGIRMGALFFLENGNISMSLAESSRITGTENNNTYQDFLNRINTIYGKVGEIVLDGDSARQTSMMESQGKLALDLINTTIEHNAKTPVGFYLLRRFSSHMDYETIEHHLDQLPQNYRKSPLLDELKVQMTIMSDEKTDSLREDEDMD